jgi:PGF-CTERM protein
MKTTSSEVGPTDTAPPTTDRTSTESETGASAEPTTGPGTGTDPDGQDTGRTDTEQAGTESQETPGFGIGTALVSLGSGAYMLKRRLDSGDNEQ